MMELQECEQIFNELAAMLRDHGLSWVCSQVDEYIQIGKTQEKIVSKAEILAIKRNGGIPKLPLKSRRGANTTFTSTSEYNSQEKLLILIDAIQQAVINTCNMEYEVAKSLGGQAGQIIFLHRDLPEGKTITSKITLTEAESRQVHAERLQLLLSELRKEI